MKVLVACEESQAVTIELRKLGHEAYSCDIEPCSGGHPEWHLQVDAIELLKMKWDMVLAFPPCTHLSTSGARYFPEKRVDGRQREAIEFFCKFLEADCDKIAIENPVNIIGGDYIKKYFPELCEKYGLPIKPTQRIQPYEYGHPYSKTTCLWLKNLQPLKPANVLEKPKEGWRNQSFTNGSGRYGGFIDRDERGKVLPWNDPRTAKIRSKTFPGIAKAMAEQWGGRCENM